MPDFTFGYDDFGRLTARTMRRASANANGGLELQTTFNHDGWRTTRVEGYGLNNANRIETLSARDGRGQVVHQAFSVFEGGAQVVAARPLGDVLSRSMTYDAAGRMRTADESRFAGDGVTATAHAEAYTYDDAGRLTSKIIAGESTTYAHTTLARTVEVDPPFGQNVMRTFDDVGRLTSVGAVSLSYNPRGQVASIMGGGLDEVRSYRPDGRLQRIQLGARQLDYAWSGAAGGAAPWLTVTDTLDGAARDTRYWLDDAQQLSAVEYGRNTPHGEAWERREYAHRPDGGRLSERVEDCDWVQALDAQGQPVWERECADEWRTAFEYDHIGQVERVDTFAFIDGVEQPAQIDQIARDGYGRVTEARTGGVHKQMTWDAAGRMLSIDADGAVSSFAYDVSGLRISRSVGGVETLSAWDSGGLLAEETGGAAKTYLRGAGLVLGVDDGAALTRLGHDHLGSPVVSVVGGVDSIRRFGALGRVRSGVVDGPNGTAGIGFTGHQLDASGLTYAQARYYDPGLGGFLTSDPWSGSLGMPRTLGRFAYVVGHPVGMVDPDGRVPWSDVVSGFHVLRRTTAQLKQAADPCGPTAKRDVWQIPRLATEHYCSIIAKANNPNLGVGERLAYMGAATMAAPAMVGEAATIGGLNNAMHHGDQAGNQVYEAKEDWNAGRRVEAIHHLGQADQHAALGLLDAAGGLTGGGSLAGAALKTGLRVAAPALRAPVLAAALRAGPMGQVGARVALQANVEAIGTRAAAVATASRGGRVTQAELQYLLDNPMSPAGLVPPQFEAQAARLVAEANARYPAGRSMLGMADDASGLAPGAGRGSLVDNNVLTRIQAGDAEALTFAGRNRGRMSVNLEIRDEFISRHGAEAFDAVSSQYGFSVVTTPAGRTSAIAGQLGITSPKRMNDLSLLAAAEGHGLRLVTGDFKLFSAAYRSNLLGETQLAFRYFERSAAQRVGIYQRIRELIEPGTSPHIYTGSPVGR